MEDNTNIIQSFSGPYRWLSNFWPVKITYTGVIYPSVEHAYHAAKTMDKNVRQEIAQVPSASQAKKYWATHPNKSKTRNWKEVKIIIMRELIKEKFSISNEIMLVRLLIETGEKKIIEGNNFGSTTAVIRRLNPISTTTDNSYVADDAIKAIDQDRQLA